MAREQPSKGFSDWQASSDSPPTAKLGDDDSVIWTGCHDGQIDYFHCHRFHRLGRTCPVCTFTREQTADERLGEVIGDKLREAMMCAFIDKLDGAIDRIVDKRLGDWWDTDAPFGRALEALRAVRANAENKGRRLSDLLDEWEAARQTLLQTLIRLDALVERLELHG